MTPLNWQQEQTKNTTGSSSGGVDPWFGIAMGLLGIIAGAALTIALSGKLPIGSRAAPPSQQAAQAPLAPSRPQEPQVSQNVPPVDPKTDHIRGNIATATVAVIEYSDFECPFCQRHHPTMKQVVDTYKDDVVWVYRHFPLNFHANAEKEAEASECANELGGNDVFWKYTDAIFERTTAGGTGFPLENLAPLAKEFGLDEAKFKTCLDSGKYAQHVKDDMAGGSAAGVSGTPGTIVLNLKTQKNQIISGAVPFASFKTAIDALLGSAPQAAVPSETARTIKMTAELWKFTPNVVTVKQGEKVTLEVTGVSGTHGLSIPGLGIEETIMQGNTMTVSIPTDKTGTFDFRCSIQCGSGHTGMTGQIVIEP